MSSQIFPTRKPPTATDNGLFGYMVKPDGTNRSSRYHVITQAADSGQEYRAVRGAARKLISFSLNGMTATARNTLLTFWDAHYGPWDRFQLEDPLTGDGVSTAGTLIYVRFDMDELLIDETVEGIYSAQLSFISVV